MVPLEKPMEKYRTYDHYPIKDSEGKVTYLRAPNIVELSNVENYSAPAIASLRAINISVACI